MGIAILTVIAIVVLLVVVRLGSPSARPHHDPDAIRAEDGIRHGSDSQFRRPPNEGDLF